MDAAADYAAAVRLMQAPLPAYVSYLERTYGSAGSFTKDTTQTIVVRTHDGAVVRGHSDKLTISVGKDVRVNPVSRPPFDPACYAPGGSRAAQWNDRAVEAIELRHTCHADDDDDEPSFDALYVDPSTHEPLVAIAEHDDDHVSVTIEQRFGRFAGNVLPSHLSVHIVGHGLAGFLNVSAGQDFSDYRFSETMP